VIECYELISVKVKFETIQARPVAWDREIYDGVGNDKNGNQAIPTEFHATCPHCGNLIHFATVDIYKDVDKHDNVKCLICNAGVVSLEEIESKGPDPEVIKAFEEMFVDPIASGVFGLEVDLELLKKIESA